MRWAARPGPLWTLLPDRAGHYRLPIRAVTLIGDSDYIGSGTTHQAEAADSDAGSTLCRDRDGVRKCLYDKVVRSQRRGAP